MSVSLNPSTLLQQIQRDFSANENINNKNLSYNKNKENQNYDRVKNDKFYAEDF